MPTSIVPKAKCQLCLSRCRDRGEETHQKLRIFKPGTVGLAGTWRRSGRKETRQRKAKAMLQEVSEKVVLPAELDTNLMDVGSLCFARLKLRIKAKLWLRSAHSGSQRLTVTKLLSAQVVKVLSAELDKAKHAEPFPFCSPRLSGQVTVEALKLAIDQSIAAEKVWGLRQDAMRCSEAQSCEEAVRTYNAAREVMSAKQKEVKDPPLLPGPELSPVARSKRLRIWQTQRPRHTSSHWRVPNADSLRPVFAFNIVTWLTYSCSSRSRLA